MAEADDSFALRIERSMAGLERLAGWVDGIAAALHLEAATEFALRLCLEEAAANVVMHGAPGGAAHAPGGAPGGPPGSPPGNSDADFIALQVASAAEALEVTVEDHCGAFDPLTVASPTLPTSLEDARIGGLGIHLMRQYARSVSYDRVGDFNRLTLTIALAAKADSASSAGMGPPRSPRAGEGAEQQH